MKSTYLRIFLMLCLLLAIANATAEARDNVLSVVPPDAVAIAVIHNLADTSRSIADVAKLVQAPAPDVLSLAKGMSGLQKGLDEQGDLAVVLTSIDPTPKVVLLIPVANFDDFFAALNVKEPASGVAEVQIAGSAAVVGRKGNFAALTRAADRDGLEQFITSTTNLASDTSLATWLDANKISIAATSSGIKQLIPKLITSIGALQAQIRQNPDQKVQAAADGFSMYLSLLTAAQSEVDQYGIGLRIDSGHTIDLVSRVQFISGGAWANWAATTQPVTDDLLAGLPAGPFVGAIGNVVPPGLLSQWMKFSMQMMQSNPMFKFTPEQAQKYGELSANAMKGLRSMRMLMAVPDPGTGLFGNTSTVMMVDDSKSFMDHYEKSLTALSEIAQEVKNPMLPVTSAKRITLGSTESLEISMEMPDMQQMAAPGAPDPQKMKQLMFGPTGKMMGYLAAADEHVVVMAYSSPEKLTAAIASYKANQHGLAGDANVAKVTAALPSGSQAVAYVSLNGAIKTAQQFAAAVVPGGRPGAIPDIADSPPIGMAAKFSPNGVEGHFVVTADTLRAIGDTVAKTRAAAAAASNPPK
jgi:hypothetical protein